MQRCLNLTWQNSWYWPGFSVPFEEEEERTRLIAMCKWKHRFKQWPVTHHSSSLFWIKDLNIRSTCFTFCSFNAPCQLTPFLNLRLLVFGLPPFRWLLCVTLTPYFLLEYRSWFTPFVFMPVCKGSLLGRKTRTWCIAVQSARAHVCYLYYQWVSCEIHSLSVTWHWNIFINTSPMLFGPLKRGNFGICGHGTIVLRWSSWK